MKKVIYEVPFTNEVLKKVEETIKDTLELYLKRNPEVNITPTEKARLIGQAKDQLTVFIQDLSKGSEKWTMSHKRVPVLVFAKEERKANDLMSALTTRKSEYFIYDRHTWILSNTKVDGAISRLEFNKAIRNEIYEGASTAAFYAIESYSHCKQVLRDDF